HDFTRRCLLLQRFLQLVEQPHVLYRDHCLVGEGFQKFDLSRSEGPHLDAPCVQQSNELPLLTKGGAQESPNVDVGSQLWELVLSADIGNVEWAMLAHPAVMWLIETDDADDGYGPKMGARNHRVSFKESQHHIINPTNSCRALDDSIEDRLNIGRRAADNAEHLRRCGLMLQCLPQFCVALLDLLKQANILDRDDRLRGKGFEQCYLLVGKGLYLGAADVNHTN